MSRAPRSRALWVALAVGGLSLALFLVIVLTGFGEAPEDSRGADSYSVSGLGHTALVALLEERGVPVVRSRWNTLERADPEALLVLAEPQALLPDERGRPPWPTLFTSRRHVLVVLPKREPDAASRENRRWVGSTRYVERRLLAEVLAPLDLEMAEDTLPVNLDDLPAGQRQEVERHPPEPRPPATWRGPAGWPAPEIDEPQLLEEGRGLTPLLACEAGVLVGRIAPAGGPVVTVVSDPDLLANHGLVRGRNAELTLAVLETARDGRRTLIWDETFHSQIREPSLGRLLMRPPMGLLVASLALLVLAAVWLGAVRFGGPRALAPVLDGGKAFLVANTADLLRVGGHAPSMLRRYAQDAEREALRRLNLEHRDPAEARAALGRVALARGLPSPESLAEEAEQAGRRGADPRRLVELGTRIHRWREELTHGRTADR